MSKSRKPRNRGRQKLVRARIKETGEPYQLAHTRMFPPLPDGGLDAAQTDPAPAWAGRSVKEFEADLRRRRAGGPLHRVQYSLEIDAREVAFGFVERLVMVPMRLAYEPDRMRVVAVELFGITGHVFAVKLVEGGYEIRGLEMDGPWELIPSIDELERRYGSNMRIPPVPALPWTGADDSSTSPLRARLGRAIYERFRLSDFVGAVHFADPTTGDLATGMLHFAQVQFEIIDFGARYARFVVEYAAQARAERQPDGYLRGEVSWSISATGGNDQDLMDGLVLVELHATTRRPVGEGSNPRSGSAPFLEMMKHLREHTGEIEVDTLDPNEPTRDSRDANDQETIRGEIVASLYLLNNGRRETSRAGSALKVRITQDECTHLIRAGAWWTVRINTSGHSADYRASRSRIAK